VRIDLVDHSLRPSNYKYRLDSYRMESNTLFEVKV
jgi:hypothetical protein